MKAADKKLWYVQPVDGAWVNGVFEQQNNTVRMTDDEAKYLVMANVLNDKPFVQKAPMPTEKPADGPAEKSAKKAGAK